MLCAASPSRSSSLNVGDFGQQLRLYVVPGLVPGPQAARAGSRAPEMQKFYVRGGRGICLYDEA